MPVGDWELSAARLIMTQAIVAAGSWRNRYIAVAVIQLTLALIFLLTLRLWSLHSPEHEKVRKAAASAVKSAVHAPLAAARPNGFRMILHRKGLLLSANACFFLLCRNGDLHRTVERKLSAKRTPCLRF